MLQLSCAERRVYRIQGGPAIEPRVEKTMIISLDKFAHRLLRGAAIWTGAALPAVVRAALTRGDAAFALRVASNGRFASTGAGRATRARALLDLGRAEEALEILGSNDGGSAAARLRIEALAAAGRLTEAFAESRERVARRDATVADLALRLRLCRRAGTADPDALAQLSAQGSTAARLALARHRMAEGDLAGARDALAALPTKTREARKISLRLALSGHGEVDPAEVAAVTDAVQESPLAAACAMAIGDGAAALAGAIAAERRSGRCGVLDYLIAHLLLTQGQARPALARLDRVLANDPRHGEALAEKALAHELLGQPNEATAAYRAAVTAPFRPARRTPAEPGLAVPSAANTRFRLAARLLCDGAGDEARAVLADIPDLVGDAAAAHFGATRWNGEPLAGKRILVITRRGIGDEVRALAAMQSMLADAAAVTLTVDPRLAGAVARSYPRWTTSSVARPHLGDAIARSGNPGLPPALAGFVEPALRGPFDVAVDGERLLRAAFFAIKPPVARPPLLVPDRERRAVLRHRWKSDVPNGPLIALGWRGLVNKSGRSLHYFGVDDLPGFRAGAAATLLPLQPDPSPAELDALAGHGHVLAVDFDTRRDLEGVIAALSLCDACIVAPSALAELAAAAGVPTVHIVRFEAGYTLARFTAQGRDRLTPWVKLMVAKGGETPRDLASRSVDAAIGMAATPRRLDGGL